MTPREELERYENARLEGHWNDDSNRYPQFSMPVHSDVEHPLKTLILLNLNDAEHTAQKFRFMGFSVCRCCGKRNGTAEFYREGWKWPDGFKHYIDAHNIIPSEDFMSEILGIKA